MAERALLLDCAGEELPAILHAPDVPQATGVLIVVGGPQYRIGSHRQFVLLARALAAAGYPVLRFDVTGMGDASGPAKDFEQIDADIAAATECFYAEQPGLTRIVLWGLCDAASAGLFRAARDPRVAGLVLANPWVRTPASEAQAYIKHYYWRRLGERAFWRKLFSGGLQLRASLNSLLGFWRQRQTAAAPSPGASLPERMAAAWRAFPGAILLLLSGEDLTAREFLDVARAHPAWTGLLDQDRVARAELPEANHTFSSAAWRDQVAELTIGWLERL